MPVVADFLPDKEFDCLLHAWFGNSLLFGAAGNLR